ncbi:unnamed protein product [Linum trigynum]|uniref:Uncharacterized protein n=1 Tax=Linum trigynum TaxID=586398 RepID=A0AAV2E284_9ROSI
MFGRGVLGPSFAFCKPWKEESQMSWKLVKPNSSTSPYCYKDVVLWRDRFYAVDVAGNVDCVLSCDDTNNTTAASS